MLSSNNNLYPTNNIVTYPYPKTINLDIIIRTQLYHYSYPITHNIVTIN